jgi:serine/threonine-protein kinase
LAIDIAWLQHNFPNLQNLRLLGRGGQKEVFSAHHAIEGDVVLKLINPLQDLESVRREILAVARVQSARVPTILDQGQIQTQFGTFVWLREERIMGDSLRDILRGGPLAPQEIVKLGVQMLEALAQAEAVQIVHRDVKPENIMRDGKGDYWLLDFGIARHLTLPSVTPTAWPFGKFTLGYASPEQCRNVKSDIDSRADLFALGVTLYECASGTNPFLVPPPANDLEKLRRVETVPLAPLAIGISGANLLRDLIQAATQKRRDLRPRTAQAALNWMREIEARQQTS